jgi:hypothetical protein
LKIVLPRISNSSLLLQSVGFQNLLDFAYANYTLAYRVTSLPDVPFDIGELYAGLIPIDLKNTSRALYFVYQPTIGTPVDEIVIWLNGGPGMLYRST